MTRSDSDLARLGIVSPPRRSSSRPAPERPSGRSRGKAENPAARRYPIGLLGVLVGLWAWGWPTLPASAQPVQPAPQVVSEVQHDVSLPLREMVLAAPALPGAAGPWLVPKLHPKPVLPPEALPLPPEDPGLQAAALERTKHQHASFPGIGANGYAPPDTNGAAGTTQYVQWVNVDYAVYDKGTGALLLGPVAGNSFWSGFGGPCETHNDGDIIAQFDKAAGRWVMAQPVFSSPYMYCVAVSTSSDATGSYNRYAFSIPNNYFPDYPKLAVWADGYYVSFNAFDSTGSLFFGALACALDRNAMLAGHAATGVCFQNGSSVDSLLPSDADGSASPPAGSPNYFVHFVSNALDMYRFHADFTTPSNSTFTGPTSIPVNAFSEACGGGVCVPQKGTGQKLYSLGDRLMYRLAYRNFGNHESLVVNHSIAAGSSVGARWYELRQTPPGSGGFGVYQQGTFAPDSSYRWMGSVAMDKAGNIALGYSVSSGGMHPSIAYTVHVPGTDALGAMEAERTIVAGSGSQTGGLDRWGDYSSMSVDPVDDCTFWYTNEYLPANGSFNWQTQIASFALPSCTGPTLQTVSPASGAQGQQNLAVTLTGQFTHFAQGTSQVSFGTGITVGSVTVASATSLTASISIASTAAVGAQTVTVTTGAEVVSLTNGFTVTTAAPATLTLANNGKLRDRVGQGDTALAPDGALDGTLTATLSASGGRTVTGLRLDSDAPGIWDTTSGNPWWVLGVATTLDGALLNAPGSMAVNFPVANGGSFVLFASDYLGSEFLSGRTLTLTATFADGSTATATTTVAGAAVTVTSVAPTQGALGAAVPVTITGTGFATGATVSVGAGITVSNVSVGSATQVTATLTIASGATLGARDVTVTNAGGGSGTLPGGFTVVSAGSATLTLGYNGKLRDRVGQGDTAPAPDGALDGTLTATLSASGGRTVTALRLDSNAPGTWDTTSGDPWWVLGVATTLDGALLNAPGSMAVNFPVANGGSFVLFASDYQAGEFLPGRTLTLTATFADGSTATAVTTVPAGSATLTLGYNGKLRDRVGQGDAALAPDGALDGTLTATLSASGSRTVTALRLDSNAPGTWDTTSGNPWWVLGVATTLDGALLNAPGSMAVNFPVANGGSFVLFASDYQAGEFLSGRVLTLTATFADGSTATATTTVP